MKPTLTPGVRRTQEDLGGLRRGARGGHHFLLSIKHLRRARGNGAGLDAGDRRTSALQRIVGPLAGLAGDGGAFSESSNSVRSLVQPSGQLGTQIDGR